MAEHIKNLIQLLENAATQSPDKYFNFTSYDTNSSDSLSFSELFIQSKKIAAAIQKKTKPQDRVILLFSPGLNFIIGFYACILSGVIAIPLPPPVNPESAIRFENVIKNSQPKLLLSEKLINHKFKALDGAKKIQSLQKIPFFSKLFKKYSKKNLTQAVFIQEKIQVPNIPWILIDDLKNKEKNLKWKPINPAPSERCYIQYTSGSTRQPQGVLMTHENVLSNLEATKQSLNLSDLDTAISWLPYYHDMGLIGYLFAPIMNQANCYLMSPFDFLRNPFNWLDSISKHGGTVTSAPNFAYDLCVQKITEAQKSKLDLSKLRIAMSGGEPIQASTIQSFTEKFTSCGFHPEAFVPAYGLAEATLGVSMKSPEVKLKFLNLDQEALKNNSVLPTDNAVNNKIIYSCGPLLLNLKIQLVNPETHEALPENHIGEIWLQGPSIAEGYWGQTADFNQASPLFSAYLNNKPTQDNGPYLKTGDLGFIHNQELYITGRLKDMIILRGHNYYPHDIEHTVEHSASGIKQGGVIAFSIHEDIHQDQEKLVIIAELNKRGDLNPSQYFNPIKQAISHKHGLETHEILLIPPRTLQKTTSGKIQRQKTKSLYLENLLPVITSWKKNESLQQPPLCPLVDAKVLSLPQGDGRDQIKDQEITIWLKNWIKTKKNLSEQDLNNIHHIADLGLDSLDLTEFVVDLKNQFNISIDPLDLLNYESLEQLADDIQEKFKTKNK